MTHRREVALPIWGSVLLWFVLALSSQAESHFIRLHNELILTDPEPAQRTAARLAAQEQTGSGLFLIQFKGPIQEVWRDQLRAMGVHLVRFVPEDAFIAQVEDVQPNRIRALPFIKWVGKYQPEHKVHPSLIQTLKTKAAAADVQLLLSPRASTEDRLAVLKQFARIDSQAVLPMGTVVRGQLSSQGLLAVSRSESVLWVEPRSKMRVRDEISSKIVGGGDLSLVSRAGAAQTTETEDAVRSAVRNSPPNTSSGVDPLHATVTQQLGYDGKGVVVAVADTGLNNGDAETMHPDLLGRVDSFLFYGTLRDAADEYGHGTHVAGIIAGSGATGEADDNGFLYGLGVAPGAHLVAQRVFDANGQDQLPDYETLTHDAVRAQAVIASNSWGDDVQGRYDLNAAQFDALVRDADAQASGDQPLILVFSAGNAGPGRQSIDSPAVAKNVIATGASENDRSDFATYTEGHATVADFSSRGPCEDGRVKPDLVAPGTWIASLKSSAAGDQNALLPISANYQYQGGSSQAVPHVAGATAVFVQYYRDLNNGQTPSPALVKAALINSAVEIPISAQLPNFDAGWGRVALTNLVSPARRNQFIEQTNLLATGQSFEQTIVVASGSVPLKITMAYTDVPGLPAALPALVNDLDLEVFGPGGKVYHGNQLLDGESVDGAAAADNLNNVELVQLHQPGAGEYTVRVHARSVAEDVHHRDGVLPQQDFAIAISGDLAQAGQAELSLDRSAYTAPGSVGVILIAPALVGQPTADVLLRSSSEPAGEVVLLQASGGRGVFVGTIRTSLGTGKPDGQLQISQGDLIEAIYPASGSTPVTRMTAQADLRPPVVSQVTATNHLGTAMVGWVTDKPTSGTVVYGTNLAASLMVSTLVLSTNHTVALQNLVPGASYQFYVVASDAAGNSTTNNNAGQFYTFTAALTPSVLLVDAFVPDDPSAETVPVPLKTYTDALDASGFGYQVWDLTAPGAPSPTAADLSPFGAVIWRISDSYASKSTLSDAQQAALTTYIDAGGSLMIASMEILSRLGPVPFRRNILQVQGFVTNPLHGINQCASCDEDHGVSNVVGSDFDFLTSQFRASLDYSNYASPVIQNLGIPTDVSDTFTPTIGAVPVLFDTSSGKVVGIRYPRTPRDRDGRVVFLSFPFDALAEATRGPLMRSVLNFLAPEAAQSASISLDRAAYSIPDLVTAEVADAALAGQGQVTAMCFSSTSTNGLPITLSETSRRGVFRGHLTLVSSLDPAGEGKLLVKTGDNLWVNFTDTAGGRVVSAGAVIDLYPPQISNITPSPDYEHAIIRWTTSEAADGLVQFGESTFLGRTAYSADLVTDHELTLASLKPNRAYFYRIVSRDAAGNAAVDDNHGKLYSFRTLTPFPLPWVDNLDQPSTNWVVQSAPASETEWSFGSPQNGLQTSAHTSGNVWGSNRTGSEMGFAQTSLLSPPLALEGGNTATLQFWQSYDFGDDSSVEEGKLLLMTNSNLADAVPIAEITGTASDWNQAVYDLSPFLGHVVRIVWEYDYLAADEPVSRPGWILDDFSVEVTNRVFGQIIVSNNLAQATFTLTGPLARNGQGWSTIISNAPPGQYVLEFADVPFYDTPPPQTNVLSAGVLVFQGNYTFVDSNGNGIPDSWEQQYFGGAAPGHAASTDTDGDGFSDYAEFIAGTDPTDPQSFLSLGPLMQLPNGMCRLSWDAVSGRAYRVLRSSDAQHWAPFSNWIRASSSQLSYTIAPDPHDKTAFFNLEVQP